MHCWYYNGRRSSKNDLHCHWTHYDLCGQQCFMYGANRQLVEWRCHRHLLHTRAKHHRCRFMQPWCHGNWFLSGHGFMWIAPLDHGRCHQYLHAQYEWKRCRHDLQHRSGAHRSYQPKPGLHAGRHLQQLPALRWRALQSPSKYGLHWQRLYSRHHASHVA